MKQALLSILIFGCVISVASAKMQKMEIIDAVERKAVCNDGSPGAYFFEPGSGDGLKRWVIVLPGIGYFCNAPGCPGRENRLMSSLAYPEEAESKPEGLGSTNPIQNPDFYNANHVNLIYCSSDLYSGNRRDETPGAPALEFRGRKIVRSIIRDLMTRSGPNLAEPGIEVLLVGWSGGGIGVMIHLDWLSKKLPNAKVRGLNDSGWLPLESDTIRSFSETEIAKGIALWKGYGDRDCMRANRRDKTKCFLSTAFPHITTPLFIVSSKRDYGWLKNNFPRNYKKALRVSLDPVPFAFSLRNDAHMVSMFRTFVENKIQGYTLAQTLGNWFFDRPGPVKLIQ